MAEEKKSHDITPDEKYEEGPTRHELAQETTDRRKSVALNIVENPLKVRRPTISSLGSWIRVASHLPRLLSTNLTKIEEQQN
jgi:hypothetical protein